MSADYFAKVLSRLGEFMRTEPAGFDAADAKIIARGVDRFFRECCTLDEAMGVLLDPGENHPGTSLAKAKRDAALCAAALMLGPVTRENLRDLAQRFARYFEDVWPRERTLDACPRPGRIEGYFWTALKARQKVLGEKQIRNILAAQQEVKSAFNFHARDGRSKRS